MPLDPRQPGRPGPVVSPTRTEAGAGETPVSVPGEPDPTLRVGAPAGAFAAPGAETIAQLGPYRLTGTLGAGGMGIVYEAEDTLLHRRVALKVIRPGLPDAPAAKERFLREARACARVSHDNIVTIFQVGEERGLTYMAMQLLEGESLDQTLQREKSLPINDLVRIGREVATGLAAAHAHGLIHRDIKPANIWLEAPDGRVKLLDFGLARAATSDEALTQQGMIVGTPAYMSPEQSRGEVLDARSDLFSLGCILYQMATGERPFEGPTVVSVLRNLELHHPPLVTVKKPQVPTALSNLIMELLCKDPARRPASAKDVAARLAKFEPKRGFFSSKRLPTLSPPPAPAVSAPGPTASAPGPAAWAPAPRTGYAPSNDRNEQERRRSTGFMQVLLLLLLFGGAGVGYWSYSNHGTLFIDTGGSHDVFNGEIRRGNETVVGLLPVNTEIRLRPGDYQIMPIGTIGGFRVEPSGTVHIERGGAVRVKIFPIGAAKPAR